jgi:hypothetical protein
MKTYLTYGLGLAIAGALLVLVIYFLGLHSDAAKLGMAQLVGTVGGLAIGIVGTALGVKARRTELPPTEDFGYGRAVGAGVMITLFASLFGIVTNFVYFTFINPGFSDIAMAAQVEKMEAKGLSSAQIEGAQKVMHFMMSPVMTCVFGFIFGMIFGTIISLVVAAFLKRPAQAFSEPPPVAS